MRCGFKASRTWIGKGDAHHLFGFHDVSPWNAKQDRMLSLEVAAIDHPPLPSVPALVGVLDLQTKSFQQHDVTTGWNFPQGARQIWLSDRSHYAYNCPNKEQPRTRVRDELGAMVAEAPWGVAAVGTTTPVFYSIDFGRIHRAGGYGHAGVRPWNSDDPLQRAGGIVRVDIATGSATTVVSLDQCRRLVCGANTASTSSETLDYVTHVVPSPSGTYLSFLYRSWLADGGIDTALCVVDAAGGNPRLLHRGNLSHFDWKSENALMIWGPRRQFVTSLRGKGGKTAGLTTAVLKLLKNTARPLLRQCGMLASCYTIVKLDGTPPEPFFPQLLTCDGHPSFCPANRDWMLADTYPNSAGDRELFLLDASRREKHTLGTYREPKRRVDESKAQVAMAGVAPSVLRIIGKNLYAFTRSGLHCDLHPRWRIDGQQVTFDSLHDGSRQIYVVDTAAIVR